MERAVRKGDPLVYFEVDSDLVAKQMNFRSGCKNSSLKGLFADCCAYGKQLTDMGVEWKVRHIYREFNQTADSLANAAIDDEPGNGPSEAL